MSVCNGVKTETGSPNSFLETSELRECPSSFDEKDVKIEVFRGFKKEPVVVLPRHDITPYLRNPLSVTDSKSTNSAILMSLVRDCSVRMVNDDLIKLKNSFLIRSPRSDISESRADEAMGHLRCKICKKIYSSEKKLQNHEKNKHMIIYRPESKPQKRVSFSDHVIVHEVKEYHKCRKCPRIFEDYKSLKGHMKQRHKKRKCYICNYCNKNFVDRMFFKVHIRLHCDVCGQLLPNKAKLAEHRRIVCGVLKLHKCRTCNDNFFSFMDLKDHSYEHLSTLYICDICKDQFTTKCAVSHHLRFLHSKQRPGSLYDMRNLGSERLYLCKFCDESSVDRDLIEAHIQLLPDLSNRVITGYKDYYFCDQCLKKFDTEKDMLQHKWTHFLKTSDNSQIRERVSPTKIKTKFKIGDKIPDYMLPSIVLERISVGSKVSEDAIDFVDVNNFDIIHGVIKKPIVDPKSKKTIISRYQCEICQKFYSSSYCLTRHKETQHSDYEHLRCNVCEETFVWPSLLQSHRCIRSYIPNEMQFDDARPEIHFDNLHELTQNGIDDFNIMDNDDYMNSVDFDIPAPIVTLNECEEQYVPNDIPLQNLGYKVVMQEVPIEF